ncbi:cyclase family protein [Lutibacter holmesii]|uniref:Cyclase family protein n=1 Tax=Lutibacter holmesii TaxID=1137985 RepID=A0ABW3WKJ3_9FLAO
MIIDLTHKLKNKITVYPGSIAPNFEKGSTIEKDGFAEINITMSTHTGTHIDAPAHLIPNAKSLDQFSVEKFIGPAIVIDCSKQKEISLDLLKVKEDELKLVDFVLFYSGWQNKWNSEKYFDEFPTLTIDAVKWLAKLNLKAVGFDAISVDKMTDELLPNHHVLLKKEILIIENMTNLDKLIAKKFELNCIPLKIENSDGSPIRAFARIIN